MAKAGPHMHKTRNHLPSNAKAVSIDLLNARLADGIDLALITKQAHWNLKGPQFIAIHEMLDGFRTDQDEWNDTMAERIAQLGGTALGTTQSVAAATKLAPYPTDVYAIADHLAALIDRYAAFGYRVIAPALFDLLTGSAEAVLFPPESDTDQRPVLTTIPDRE